MTTSSRQEIKALSEGFPTEAIRKLKKGGASLDYIPVAEVIARMNAVLEDWSVVGLDAEVSSLDSDWVIAKAVVQATIDGTQRTAIGYGGQKIKKTKAGDIVDLGDEFKGASSDAIKKAAQQFGVGLGLARSEEMVELDEGIFDELASAEQLATIKGFTVDLTAERLAEFKEWWKANVGKKLDSGRVTAAEAAAAIGAFG